MRYYGRCRVNSPQTPQSKEEQHESLRARKGTEEQSTMSTMLRGMIYREVAPSDNRVESGDPGPIYMNRQELAQSVRTLVMK